jgi:indolepyruvate ferredoxin oxidoreductase alpha subunit
MLRQTIDILTPYLKQKKVCTMGNVAIARGAIESGVCGVFAYPGTPSTEISEVFNYVNEFQNKKENREKYPEQTENKIYFEYSVNEKIALEKAIAFSIGNKSAMCVMKNVGMNVACDALMSIAYQTIIAPLVIVVCDDPGCHSSSNEQDSRYWGPMASVPVFNPATPADALSMIKQAFTLSAEIKLPVIVRTTTRVSHTRGIISYENILSENRLPKFDRIPEHINIPARTASAHTRLLDKLKQKDVLDLLSKNSKIIIEGKNAKLGIISSGVASSYLCEILHQNKLTDRVEVLELGMIHPFPEKEVLDFLKKDFKEILVLEELDPFIENAVRTIAQKNNISKDIFGKGFSGLVSTGEFSIDLITNVLKDFLKVSFTKKQNTPLDNYGQFLQQLPPRPPTLCAGCPHRATFYLLKLAIPREQSELILCGDIGCFGLGALPPLKMIDTINHMGMSISMAQGLYESFNASQKGKKVVALLGDGTFFHSGLSSLVNAVYTRANILVVIFDNRTIGMTGHQSHPGASRLPKYQQIDIPQLLKGLGIDIVETIDPFNLRDGFAKLNKAMAHEGVSVVIARSPCIFLPEFKDNIDKKMKIVVDENRCNTCGNHEDIALSCSRCYAPKNNLSRAKAKLMAEHSIPAEEQLCPANICNHGFFNSVLEGDYKSAIEIVRDKMLFARTCGDICHRPCELFSQQQNIVPIKALKKFVSSFDENFHDFSLPKSRVKNADKKNSTVAIVGAGPAGLSAAYDLVQAGYLVTIFEKESKAGGMVKYAIPDFRMDKTGLDFEAMQLREMGVKFNFNATLGRDFSLNELHKGFDATILAIGLNKSKRLDVIENNIPPYKRRDALSFLKSFNLNENDIRNGSTILIIGGGNSALDAARSAKKLSPLNKVIVSCIETEDAMPAFVEEVRHAMEEGIEFIHDSFVKTCWVTLSGDLEIILYSFDSKDFLQKLNCDYIITAIGQLSDAEAMREIGKSRIDSQGRIKQLKEVSEDNNFFVAGDICSGNSMSVIGAIASGKNAAISVRQKLEDYQYGYEGAIALERLNNDLTTRQPKGTKELVSLTNNESNIDELHIEQYNLFQSCMKCNHCIDNFGCPALVKVNGKVQIDQARCTLCGLCIDVCPNNAIQWSFDGHSVVSQ